jgi:hypothetical protein
MKTEPLKIRTSEAEKEGFQLAANRAGWPCRVALANGFAGWNVPADALVTTARQAFRGENCLSAAPLPIGIYRVWGQSRRRDAAAPGCSLAGPDAPGRGRHTDCSAPPRYAIQRKAAQDSCSRYSQRLKYRIGGISVEACLELGEQLAGIVGMSLTLAIGNRRRLAPASKAILAKPLPSSQPARCFRPSSCCPERPSAVELACPIAPSRARRRQPASSLSSAPYCAIRRYEDDNRGPRL